MKIYKVYIYSSGKEFYFQKRVGANKFIREFHQEDVSLSGVKTPLKSFILENGIEIQPINVE